MLRKRYIKKWRPSNKIIFPHPDLHKALLNPILSPRDKEQLLTIAIGIEPGTLYLRGIRLLIKNHREMYIRSICLMYQKLYRKVYQIGRIKIITAVALKQETLDRDKKTGDGPDFQTDRICRKGRTGYLRGLCTPGKFHAARLFSRRRVEKNRKAIEIGEDKYKWLDYDKTKWNIRYSSATTG